MLAGARATRALDAIDRRVMYLLRLCDLDHDGILTAFDFEEWVDRLAALRGWEPGCDGYGALTELFVDQAYRGLHAARGNANGTMTLPAMREGLLSTARCQPEQARAWADALFDLLDAGDSGEIGREEYRGLLASLCIPRVAADASFARLDVDGRGRLTRDGFRAMYLGFFLDEDPDGVATWFWGPQT